MHPSPLALSTLPTIVWHEQPWGNDHAQVLELDDYRPLDRPCEGAAVARHARLGRVVLVGDRLTATEAEATVREHAVHLPLLGRSRSAARILLVAVHDPWLLGECLVHPWVESVDVLVTDDILGGALARLEMFTARLDPRVRLRPRTLGAEDVGYHLIVDGRGPTALPEFADRLAPDGAAVAWSAALLRERRWSFETCPHGPVLKHTRILHLLSAAVPGGHVALTLATRDGHDHREPVHAYTGRAYDAATHRAAFAVPAGWRDATRSVPAPAPAADPRRWWHEEIARIGWTQTLPARIVESTRSAYQQIDVREHPDFGRILTLDDTVQGSEADEHIYHEMAVHVSLSGRARQRVRALIVGGGDGGALRELLRRPEVESVELVELDAAVIDVSRRHFDLGGSHWDDPRVTVHVADGADHLAEAAAAGRQFDLILVDATDSTGPAQRLWNDDFFRDLAACLAPDGACVDSDMLAPHLDGTAQLSREWAGDAVLADIRRAARYFRGVEVYLSKVPLFPCGYFAHFVYTHDGRSHAEPVVAHHGRHYDPDLHRAAFALPPWLRALLSEVVGGGAHP